MHALRILSWNLKRGDAGEALARTRAVAQRVEAERVDILAVQEAMPEQVALLRAFLPRFAFHDGPATRRREHVAIAFDPGRVALESAGALPLPEPGRHATWARFRAGTFAFTLVNAHFGPEDASRREESAKAIAERFPDAVLVGDLNDVPGSDMARVLTENGWLDALADVPTGTIHGGAGEADARLDWALVPPGVEATDARVVAPHPPPSDHDAVRVDVRPRRVDE